tara:strand:- start:233 stop:514 length:282 start_codon:yes stop_codon:yes gene_type:complete
MADAGGLHRTERADNYSLGDYNGVTFVNSSTTFHATGSNAGAGFIVENATNVTITLSNGSTLPGSTLNTKEFYPIGVKKVAIGATGKVHILHR